MNLVNIYFLNKKFIRKDIWANGLLIEHMHQSRKLISCHVYFYGRKSLTVDKLISLDSLFEDKKLLLKSKMVVFKGIKEHKPILLELLKMFCNNINHYGLIVDTFSDEVYFFPKLGYQDGYLIKEIFVNKFQDNKIDILCGGILV